jgi:hypothetical protein
VKYNQGIARRHLLGEPTMNPTIAAKSLLGRTLVRRAETRLKSYGRRRTHRGNPLPALAALAGGGELLSKVPILGGLLKKPSETRAAAVVPAVVQSANSGNLTAVKGLIERAAKPMLAKEHAVWVAAAAQLAPQMVQLAIKHDKNIPSADQSNPEKFAASVLASPYMGGAGTGAAPSALQQFAGALTPGNVVQIARAVKPRAQRRARYPTYVDRYGRQRYSTKPPGSQMRLPAGASAAPDTPYSFFRGDVGKGGGGTTAAQLGLAAVAGTAAYFGTKAILKHFGGKAVRQEEAGVQLALAAREARYEYAVANNLRGAPPSYGVPASVIREIGAGMKAKLAELGYNDKGVRTRSASERFLSDYAPEED